jgi:gamma-polyglutamate biosynthesis protein CapA
MDRYVHCPVRPFALRGLPLCAAAALLLALSASVQPIAEPPSFTLALLGDVMLGRSVSAVRVSMGWQGCLSCLAPYIQPADLAIANLESPLADPLTLSSIQHFATSDPQAIPQADESMDIGAQGPSNAPAATAGSYNLCASPDAVDALTGAGLDVLTLANNHTRDCLDGSPEVTAIQLQAAGLQTVLPGLPLRLVIHGIPVTFLAFDDISAALDLEQVSAAIQHAHDSGDLVVVSVHWGSEYHPGPDARQRQLAAAMAEAGADLIWGHHPHVLQTVEWLQRGGHDGLTLVAYSLGNALFDQVTPPDANRSALLLVTLDAGGVRSLQAVPFEIDARRGETNPAAPETAAAVLHRLGLPPLQ